MILHQLNTLGFIKLENYFNIQGVIKTMETYQWILGLIEVWIHLIIKGFIKVRNHLNVQVLIKV